MPTYCYKTESGTCEGDSSEVTLHKCTGNFEIVRELGKGSESTKCKFCSVVLCRDLVAEGAPGIAFKGPGFHKTDYND